MTVLTELPNEPHVAVVDPAPARPAHGVRRRRATPVASLLPAVLLAAMLVGAPYSGISTSRLTAAPAPAAATPGPARAGAPDPSIGLSLPGHAVHLLIAAWLLLLVVGVGVITYVASRADRRRS